MLSAADKPDVDVFNVIAWARNECLWSPPPMPKTFSRATFAILVKRRTARHDQLGHQDLDDLGPLVASSRCGL